MSNVSNSGKSLIQSVKEDLLSAQGKTRIVENVTVAVTTGIILGAVWSVWNRITGKKK